MKIGGFKEYTFLIATVKRPLSIQISLSLETSFKEHYLKKKRFALEPCKIESKFPEIFFQLVQKTILNLSLRATG